MSGTKRKNSSFEEDLFYDYTAVISSMKSGRARKKSAKVLEMEEAEELERQQTTTSKSPKGNRSASPGSSKAPEGEQGSSVIKLLLNTPRPAGSETSQPVSPSGDLSSQLQASSSKKTKTKKLKSDVGTEGSGEGELGIPKLKFHLGSRPSVEQVIESPDESKSTKKKSKKQKTEPPPPLEIPEQKEESGLKLKLILSPKKDKDDGVESFEIAEPKKKKKKQSKTETEDEAGSVKKSKKKKSTPVPEYPAAVPSESAASSSEAVDSADDSTVVSYADFIQSMEAEEAQRKADKKKQKSTKKRKMSTDSDGTTPATKEKKKSQSKKEKSVPEGAVLDSVLTIDETKEKPKKKLTKDKNPLPVLTESPVEVQDLHIDEDVDTAIDIDPSEDDSSNQDFATPAPPDTSLYMQLKKPSLAGKKKKGKKGKGKDDKPKRTRAPTAYTLWCGSYRQKIVAQNPGIDFASVSKRLGEIWHTVPEKEKMLWRRKAKKQAAKGSTVITTGKLQKPGTTHLRASAPSVRHGGTSRKPQQVVATSEEQTSPLKISGTQPIDVAAHLRLVGESLSIIGTRLKETRGQMAVQGSMTVLLDSMLCALGPLMCLTTQIPEVQNAIPLETSSKTLDNIAYFMPGL